MSVVSVWRLFAFMDGDEEGANDERRLVADWQLGDVLRWCETRGYDHIYFSRDSSQSRSFTKAKAPEDITHHGLSDGGSAA